MSEQTGVVASLLPEWRFGLSADGRGHQFEPEGGFELRWADWEDGSEDDFEDESDDDFDDDESDDDFDDDESDDDFDDDDSDDDFDEDDDYDSDWD